MTQTRRQPGYRFAVLALELDRFKLVNVSFGQLAGDELLVAVARRLGICVRRGNVVARVGSAEFAILAEVKDAAAARHITQRILDKLQIPFSVSGKQVVTSASVGVLVEPPSDHPGDLLSDAEAAMYRAKTMGGARYVEFDSSIRQAATSPSTTARMPLGAR